MKLTSFQKQLQASIKAANKSLDENYPQWDKAGRDSFIVGWLKNEAGIIPINK